MMLYTGFNHDRININNAILEIEKRIEYLGLDSKLEAYYHDDVLLINEVFENRHMSDLYFSSITKNNMKKLLKKLKELSIKTSEGACLWQGVYLTSK